MSAFDNIWSESTVAIESTAEEGALIAAAQAGDESATLTLFRAYLPTLHRIARSFWHVFPTADELRSAIALGFLEAVSAYAFTDEGRLARSVRQYAVDAVAREAGQGIGASVPPRTLKRFWGILRRAEGDPAVGAEIAPEYSMDPATFNAVYRAVVVDSDDVAESHDVPADASLWLDGGEHGYADIEDRMLVDIAFGAVTAFESDVCRMAYGFTDYEPLPDGAIGERLGYGRLKILRTRTAALSKMRAALGADE